MTAVMDDNATRATAPAVVRREERTYEEHKRDSFFFDLWHATQQNNQRAWDRLNRHQHELDVERRTNPNSTAGTGGEFDVPLWAIDKFKTQARAGRVIGDLCTNLVLPPGYESVHVPKMTTGADVTTQPADASVDVSVDQVTADAGGSNNVVTISGHVDASLQLFEQTPPPGYDGIVYKDLSLAYNQRLETQMLAGSGINGQLTGIKNVSGITSVDGSGTSATVDTASTTLWGLIGQAYAGVGNTRELPPEVVVMAPRRWAAVAAAEDSSKRPIFTPGHAHVNETVATAGGQAVGEILGLPVYVSGGIIGTTKTTADYILVMRVGDMLLYESVPKFTVNPDVLSGTMQIRLQLHRYVAFLNTIASSIAIITAIPQPTNY